MAFSLARTLNIEKNERGLVFLLLTQSVFLGIFAGALDVGANALFLDSYSAERMPQAFMISGGVGIIFTSLYTYLQKRMAFRGFTVLNLLVVILFTGLLRLGYGYTDDPRLSFLLLVMMGPVIIIAMLGFWGTAGRYFSLREGKRLFGIIDTGSIVGMILAFYAVPVLVSINFNVYDTLSIGLGSLVLALVFQLVLLRKHRMKQQEQSAPLPAEKAEGAQRKRSGFLALFRKRYTSMMAIFVALSVISAFFIHYSFMWATQTNYPESRELTGFLGAFFGTMMIFTVVIKSTLYGWLMKNYGVRVTLLLSPILLLVLTVAAAIVGGFFGYTAEAASFTFFFLVIALSKLFNKSLKDAIESPSMKILYQSLDSRERFDVQARIDGVVNEFTAFASGLLMAGILLVSFVNVMHFSYLLIAILLLWAFVGSRLYSSYRKSLNDSLASATSSREYTQKGNAEQSSINDSKHSLERLKVDPLIYHELSNQEMEEMLLSEDADLRQVAIDLMEENMFLVSDDFERKFKAMNGDTPLPAPVILQRKPVKDLDVAFRSGNWEEIIRALYTIIKQQNSSQYPHLITLFRDRDIKLRIAAIRTASMIGAKELGGYLVDYLGHPELYVVTWSSLVRMGEPVLENLENAYHKTGVSRQVQQRIVWAMTEIGGEKAAGYLFPKLREHQRDIREAAAEGLYRLDFFPAEKELNILRDIIFNVALAGAQNIVAEAAVSQEEGAEGLLAAIKQEKARNDKLLFWLLGIAYDKSAVDHVSETLIDEENEEIGFALELLNLIVEDEVYAYLEPYFDVLSYPEKIRRLQNEMPVESLEYSQLLIELLNRDSLYTGKYIRMQTIVGIMKNRDIDAGRYLAAQAFHPDFEISEAAVVTLKEKDPALYNTLLGRLGEGDTLPGSQGSYAECKMKQLLERVEALAQVHPFSNLSFESLLKVAEIFEVEASLPKLMEGQLDFFRRMLFDEAEIRKQILLFYSEYSNKTTYLVGQLEA